MLTEYHIILMLFVMNGFLMPSRGSLMAACNENISIDRNMSAEPGFVCGQKRRELCDYMFSEKPTHASNTTQVCA